MNRLFLAALLPASVFATSQAMVSTHAGAGASGTAAAIPGLTSFQVVGRIHGCTVDGIIFFNTAIRVSAVSSCTAIQFISWSDSNAGHGAIQVNWPAGATDVTFRASRVPATQSLFVEVWRTDTGAYLVASDPNIPNVDWGGTITDIAGQQIGIGNGGAGGCTCDVDYVRFFSAAPAIGTIPTANVGGDLGDWELDGSLTDASPYSQSLTGTPSYVATPLYGPLAAFTAARNCFLSTSYTKQFCSWPSNVSPLLSSASYSPNTGDALTYSWTQTAGAPVTINNPTSAITGLTGASAFGEYDFQLTVTDQESAHASATIAQGIVTVDGTGCQVTDVPTSQAFIVGPLTPWGSACDPWPWYDQAEVGDALSLQSQFAIPAVFGSSPASGTVTVQGDTTSLVGTGTHFTSDCSGSCAGQAVLVEWNAPLASSPLLPAGATGRNIQVIGTVTDDTHASFDSSQFKYNAPLGSSANIRYQAVGNWTTMQGVPAPANIIVGFGWQGQPSYSWNYYDNVTAFYRIYYRTGITLFRDYARQLADAWYVWNIDQGYASNSVPRVMALTGLMIRALDGQSGYWPGIRIKLPIVNNTPNTNGNWDVRETGYNVSYLSFAARLDPVTANRAGYCTSIGNALNNIYFLNQDASGLFTNNPFLINNNNPSYGPHGAQPWLEGVTGAGLKDAYGVLNDPTICNNPSLATTALRSLGSLLQGIYTYGINGTRTIPPANGGGTGAAGIFYSENIEAAGLNEGQNSGAGDDWFPGSGTISGTSGASSVVGTGTNFRNGFASTPIGFLPCDGSTFVAIPAEGLVHRITSCGSNTALAIADTLSQNLSGASYLVSIRDASSACAPSLAAWCFSGSPDFAVTVIGDYGWYWAQTGNAQYKFWGDDWFAMDYGGPAGGPGSTGIPVGPGATGTTLVSGFGYISPLPACNVSAPPCGGATTGHYGKDFGDGSGYVGAASNYLAWRLQGQANPCSP